MTQVIQVILDEEDRILIPPAVRERLGLSPGMTLVVEEGNSEGVRLRVQPEWPTLVEKSGVFVVKSEAQADITDIVRIERERRNIELLTRTKP